MYFQSFESFNIFYISAAMITPKRSYNTIQLQILLYWHLLGSVLRVSLVRVRLTFFN